MIISAVKAINLQNQFLALTKYKSHFSMKNSSRLLLLFFSCFFSATLLAQAPQIFYTSPNVLTVNEAIVPLVPTISGGEVTLGINVSTFAGSGMIGSTDGIGTAASFNLPTYITIGPQNTFYVIDRSNHKIRKIDASGEVTTFAGTGAAGSNDGSATEARFRFPDAAICDSNGNLFVTDQSNHKIRKITPDGIVSTFAGTGTIGAADGNGIAASFHFPAGITIDSDNNLIIADFGNNKIRKITPEGVVTTLAGTGVAGSDEGTVLTAQFNGPTGVTIDNLGNIFVADYYNNNVRKISALGNVTTLAGNGTAGNVNGFGTSASFNGPATVTLDSHNNIFLTDEQNHSIRKISPDGQVSTFAGTGTLGNADGDLESAQFHLPTGLVLDAFDNVFVCDYGNHKIRKIETYGFNIFPDLPVGLAFDFDNGMISGTPTQVSPMRDYIITASNAEGSGAFLMTIEVKVALEIPEQYVARLKFYPNPVATILNLEASQNMKSVTVLNMLGQEVLSKANVEKTSTLDLSMVDAGMYLVQVKTTDGEKTFKIVKR